MVKTRSKQSKIELFGARVVQGRFWDFLVHPCAGLRRLGLSVTPVGLGFALVASNSNSLLPEAERILKAGLQMDPNSPIGYSQLAIAQGRQGKTAEADLSTARGLMARGDFRAAKRYAARAQKNLKRGTPAWLQADDIVSYNPPDFAKQR